MNVWVKEEAGVIFTVPVPVGCIVDGLKDAIKAKMVYSYGAPLLTIKSYGRVVLSEDDAVVQNYKGNAYLFTQPVVAPSKRFHSLVLSLLLYLFILHILCCYLFVYLSDLMRLFC